MTVISAAVTDFTDALGYCEYKIPLSIQGIKPRPSQALISGAKAHKAEEKYEQEHIELEPVSIQQIKDKQKDVEFAREDIYSTLNIPFKFLTENVMVSLSGRIDKILRAGETLIVQDDKFAARPEIYDNKTQPYPNQLLQVLVYLNSAFSANRGKRPEDCFEMPHTRKKWQIRICDRKTREPYKIFSEFQDSASLRYLHLALEKFAKISLEIAEPEHHNIVAKCIACSLKSMCDHRL